MMMQDKQLIDLRRKNINFFSANKQDEKDKEETLLSISPRMKSSFLW
jgi:hypothetical protein